MRDAAGLIQIRRMAHEAGVAGVEEGRINCADFVRACASVLRCLLGFGCVNETGGPWERPAVRGLAERFGLYELWQATFQGLSGLALRGQHLARCCSASACAGPNPVDGVVAHPLSWVLLSIALGLRLPGLFSWLTRLPGSALRIACVRRAAPPVKPRRSHTPAGPSLYWWLTAAGVPCN